MDLFLTYMQRLSQNISNNAKHPLFGEGTNADSPSSSRRNSKFSQDKGKSFVNLHSKSPGRAWQGLPFACCENYFYRILERAEIMITGFKSLAIFGS